MEKTVSRPVIYTLGTSTRGLEEFMETLGVYEIESVVDEKRAGVAGN